MSMYDPAQLLCPADAECYFSDLSLRPYYFDSSHLTLTGSAVLKPLFEESLAKVK